ncbi:hypothetical protein EYR36_008193 [Pleurotus pulmonarius]|nr:hypothetical protein EYR36_008193 [Pleurotus pulmonarius]
MSPLIRYNHYIATSVSQHPFHVFDTYANRTITRAELIENISVSLEAWTKCPVTCTALLGTIENVIYSEFITTYTTSRRQKGFEVEEAEWREWLTRRVEGVRPYVYSAMMRTGGVFIDSDSRGDSGEDCSKFISSLESSLFQYNTSNPQYHVPVPAILSATRDLIRENQTHASIPTHMVREQIELLGQYAILSHRWERPVDQELYFTDIEESFGAQSCQGAKIEPRRSRPSSRHNSTTEVVAARNNSAHNLRPLLPTPPREAGRKQGRLDPPRRYWSTSEVKITLKRLEGNSPYIKCRRNA